MPNKIKLNLGCGVMYKPGYLNLDKFDDSVADKICNAEDLSFKANSVDTIEALHLIEHFDWIHCKYILSEWFRILKPNGRLIIETPDFEKSFKKFRALSLESKKTTLQWIYGIDSPGMQHKTGFTLGLIRNLLKEVGFEKISAQKPTYRYEPGILVVCQKPPEFLNKQLFALARKRIKKELEIGNSFLLIPLEKWINKTFNIYSAEFPKQSRNCVNKIIAKTSICHPLLPKIFLEECLNFGLFKPNEIKGHFMDYLTKIEFHKKLFSLWMKRKKTIQDVGEVFGDFIKEMKLTIMQCLDNGNGKQRLDYIQSLDPVDVKIFDLEIVQHKSREWFNQGVKKFTNQDFSKALNLFLKSAKINPVNPLNYWNMARLKGILNYNASQIIENYKNTLLLIKNKNIKKEIMLELNNYQRSNLVPQTPISEDYQII